MNTRVEFQRLCYQSGRLKDFNRRVRRESRRERGENFDQAFLTREVTVARLRL
jgi:hypothetical protein